MKCAYCGKNNKDDAVLCKRCGGGLNSALNRGNAELDRPKPEKVLPAGKEIAVSGDKPEVNDVEATVEETEKQKKLSKKTIAILIAVGAAVIGIAVLVLYLVLQTGITLPKKNGYTILPAEGLCEVVYKGKAITYPDTSEVILARTSIDKSKAGVLTENGALYYYHDGKYNTVANNATWFAISANGGYIAYMDVDGRLWSYNGKKDSSPTSISGDPVMKGFVLSPDGNSILFSKQAGNGLYLCVKGKVTDLRMQLSPISVSKNGKCIYAYNSELNTLYVINKKGGGHRLCDGIGELVWLNDDHTEIAFTFTASTGVEQTLISYDGGEPVEIHNSKLMPVLTASTQIEFKLDGAHRWDDIYTCPINTFDDRFFVGCGGQGLVHYSKKSGAKECDASAEFAVVDDRYKVIYYISAGELRYGKLKELRESGSTTQLATDCVSVCISANGKVAWYTDSELALHYHKGDTDKVVLTGIDDFIVKKDGAALILKNNRMYYSKDGNAKKLSKFNPNAEQILTDVQKFYYYDGDLDSWAEVDSKGRTTIFGD